MLRRLLLVVVVCLFYNTPAWATRERIQGWCQNGGTTVTVPGTAGSGTQPFQQTFRGCLVTVYNAGTVVAATIYSDAAGTAQANPFTANATTGAYNFYADGGRYDIRFSGGGISSPFTLGDFRVPNEVFNVTDYGALCDGSTNDATAFQRASTAALVAGGMVRFPAGNCVLTSGITFGNGVTFEGSGPVATTIQYNGAAGQVFRSNNTASFQVGAVFRDFGINLTNATDVGIDLTSFSNSVVENVRIIGGTAIGNAVGVGIRMDANIASSYANMVLNPYLEFLTTGVQIRNGANENRIIGGQITTNTNGIYIDNSGAGWGGADISEPDNALIEGVRIEANTNGVTLSGRNHKLIGNRLESNTTSNVNIIGAASGSSWEPYLFLNNFVVGTAYTNNSTSSPIRVLYIGENQFEYVDPTSPATRYYYPAESNVFGNDQTNGTTIIRNKSNATNANLALRCQGSSPASCSIELGSSATGDWVTVTGGSAGVTPVMASAGNSTNIPLTIDAKGSSGVNIDGSATDYLTVTGAANLVDVFTAGGGTNVTLRLSSEGTGPVSINTIQGIQLLPTTVGALTACSAGLRGRQAVVTDSNTATWGATVAAGGANNVLIWCNGTNWTVVGA